MKKHARINEERPRATAKAIAKVRTDTKKHESEASGVETVSKSNLYIIGGMAAAVGFWALACLASAIMNSDGASHVFRNWLTALSGI